MSLAGTVTKPWTSCECCRRPQWMRMCVLASMPFSTVPSLHISGSMTFPTSTSRDLRYGNYLRQIGLHIELRLKYCVLCVVRVCTMLPRV